MRESNMNISVWRKWAIVWMVSVLSGFQLRAADPVVIPANTEPLMIPNLAWLSRVGPMSGSPA